MVLIAVLGLVSLVLVVFAIIYVVPLTNRMFANIWEDPSSRQKREALKRLKELYVDGHLPKETAVLLAAAERNATEEELLEVIQMIGAGELKSLATGQKSAWGVIINGLENAIKRNAGYERNHR